MNNIKNFTKTLTNVAIIALLVVAVPSTFAAKGGGGKISVTAASPGEALQGEELEVVVSGSGFDEGTTATYLVTGTSDDTQIEVISTEYVNENQLRTKIKVKDGATVIDYDIQATNSRGRRGKGTTLFSVKQTGGGGGGPSNLGDDYTATDGVTFNSDAGLFDYHIIGTALNDEIYAGSGADLIEGGYGADDIWARGGDDEIHSGTGGGTIRAGSGNDTIFGSVGGDSIYGDDGDDIVFGGASGEAIRGGLGTDWLEGGGGDDWIAFSLGSLIALPDKYETDHYDGGPGHDLLVLDEGVINEESTEEIVESSIIDMSLGTYEIVARDPFGTLVTLQGDFFNIEAVWGGKADDVFYGGVVGDDFWGGDGDNIMYGYGGNDRIGTGGGNNIIYGGSGHDKLSPWDGDDIVFGGSGDDFLESWGGNDEFHGGEGCDGYIYLRPGTFTIMDFEACDLVYYPVNSHDSKFLETNISVVGDDIIIEFTSRKKSNGSSTIILRNAALNGVTVDESTIIYDWPHWDCDVYWNNGPHC